MALGEGINFLTGCPEVSPAGGTEIVPTISIGPGIGLGASGVRARHTPNAPKSASEQADLGGTDEGDFGAIYRGLALVSSVKRRGASAVDSANESLRVKHPLNPIV